MTKRFHHWLMAIGLTLASVIAIVGAGLYYLIATPGGTVFIIKYAVLQTAQYASVNVGSSQGTLAYGWTLKDVTIKNSPVLGTGAIVRLQRVEIRLIPWAMNKIQVNVFNGRLDLPKCDALIFNGQYSDGVIQGNAYGGGALDVGVVMQPFLLPEVMHNLHGTVTNMDFMFAGEPSSLRIIGHFYVDRIKYISTTVHDGMSRFDLAFSKDNGQWRMNGPLILEGGTANVSRTNIDLQPSRATFKGNVLNPDLTIYGKAKADEYTIFMSIKGTLVRPQVHLTSDPYLPEDMALMVLGLGTTNWTFGNSSHYYGDGKRIDVKRKFTNDVKLGLEIEQSPSITGEQPEYTQKLAGELSLTDKISFNVAEQILTEHYNSQTPSTPNDNRGNQSESEFYLQYKNHF